MALLKLPRFANYAPGNRKWTEPSKESSAGLSVPFLLWTGGDRRALLKKIPLMLPYPFLAVFRAFKSIFMFKLNPPSGTRVLSGKKWAELDDFLFHEGISSRGFTEVPAKLIFSNGKIPWSKALVLTKAMNSRKIAQAPSFHAGREVWRTYSDLGRVVNRVAVFLRKKGIPCLAGPALGGDVNYPLLAEKAGLGYVGRHGLLISPEAGSCLRIAVVYMDIASLPSVKKREYPKDICDTCQLCVQICPSGAIFPGKRTQKRFIDYKKCIIPFSRTMGCSLCIKVCPYTQRKKEE